MDEKRQQASSINLQLRRLEKELEETTDKAKREQLGKEIEALRLSIS
jgi:hypothetical protein